MINPLSFKALTNALASVFEAQPDSRQPERVSYSLSDAGLAAFSVFFMQSPSFLAYQRDNVPCETGMAKRKGTSNAQTLFGMERIPTGTHPWRAKDNLLGPIPAEALFAPFRYAFRALAEGDVLERFKTGSGQLLLALDGTEHFASEKIHCPNCSMRLLKNGKTRYSHSVVTPLIVSPEQSEVISLEPAFILDFVKDGEEKQDCEINASLTLSRMD